MSNIRNYWDGLKDYEKILIIRENLFWDGLFQFKYELIPEDLKRVLSKKIEEKPS